MVVVVDIKRVRQKILPRGIGRGRGGHQWDERPILVKYHGAALDELATSGDVDEPCKGVKGISDEDFFSCFIRELGAL
jgi:hypothetical protein